MKMRQWKLTTPEGISYAMPLASPVLRMVALAIDILIMLCVFSLVSLLMRFLFFVNDGIVRSVEIVLTFILWIMYPMVMEWRWNGRTVGKKVLGIRVIDAGGRELTFSQCVIRNLIRLGDMMPGPYLLGAIIVSADKYFRRLGDIAAGTVVVHSGNLANQMLREGVSANRVRYNTLLAWPGTIASLREAISPSQLRIAVEALSRAEKMDTNERLHLFEIIGGDFRKMIRLPEDALGLMSDEQLVQNVVDALLHGA